MKPFPPGPAQHARAVDSGKGTAPRRDCAPQSGAQIRPEDRPENWPENWPENRPENRPENWTDIHSDSRPGPDRGASPGFVHGSVVLTLDGAMPVEFLAPGDRIITRDRGLALLGAVEPAEAECACVAVAAGALGAGSRAARPDRDVILPAGQMVLLRDWRAQALFGQDQALAPVSRLVDGEFIRPAGRRCLRLVRLVFDAPHILYVDGMELAASPPAPAAPPGPLRRVA